MARPATSRQMIILLVLSTGNQLYRQRQCQHCKPIHSLFLSSTLLKIYLLVDFTGKTKNHWVCTIFPICGILLADVWQSSSVGWSSVFSQDCKIPENSIPFSSVILAKHYTGSCPRKQKRYSIYLWKVNTQFLLVIFKLIFCFSLTQSSCGSTLATTTYR